MNVPELIIGAILGVVIGAPLGALVRPHIAWLEKRSRRTWNADPLIQHCERDPSIIWAGVRTGSVRPSTSKIRSG